MNLFNKILRKLYSYSGDIQNSFRIFKLKILFPNIYISSSTKISKGCSIKSTVDSKLSLINCFIGPGTHIHADHGGQIQINDSFVGPNCIIVSRNQITINSNCQIAEMVVIRDQNHNFGALNKKITEQGFNSAPIVIGQNVWLAAKVTVTAGSVVGSNTIVGANAVVRGVLDATSVYVGVPAKKIKSF